MRRIRLVVLIAALASCIGASECSSSSGGGKAAANDFGTGVQVDDPNDRGPVAPMPEPGSAALFGLGALIAAAATRRLKARRD